MLDVGCGNGLWLKRLRQLQPGIRDVEADLSLGMLRSLVAHWEERRIPPVTVVDAQALPFRDGSVDVALMIQMLYHVPNRAKALLEVRRVLSAQGAVVVATPALHHLQELRELLRLAISDVRQEQVVGPFLKNPFDVDTAVQELQANFSHVESYVRTGLLEIPQVDPVVAYLDSQQGPDLDELLPARVAWSDVLNAARRRAEAVIADRHAFTTPIEVGAFVCRP